MKSSSRNDRQPIFPRAAVMRRYLGSRFYTGRTEGRPLINRHDKIVVSFWMVFRPEPADQSTANIRTSYE